MKVRACSHRDLRDCGPCLAEAHQRATETTGVLVFAAPDGPERDAAIELHLDAKHAKIGHALLWAHGIAAMVLPSHGQSFCRHCNLWQSADVPCRDRRCPGRRVRFEAPAVRR
jgi:hypothetical protein